MNLNKIIHFFPLLLNRQRFLDLKKKDHGFERSISRGMPQTERMKIC